MDASEALRKARATEACADGCHFLAICGDQDTSLFQQNASVTADGHTQIASALLDGFSVSEITAAERRADQVVSRGRGTDGNR